MGLACDGALLLLQAALALRRLAARQSTRRGGGKLPVCCSTPAGRALDHGANPPPKHPPHACLPAIPALALCLIRSKQAFLELLEQMKEEVKAATGAQ